MRYRVPFGAGLALALFSLTCTDRSPSGPGGVGTAAFDLSAFRATAAGDAPVPTDSVRIIVRRTADQAVLRDIAFALAGLDSTNDSAVVRVSVPLSAQVEDVSVTVNVFGAGVVWYTGSTTATLTEGGTATPPALTLTYVGLGAGADSVRIQVLGTRVIGGASVTLGAAVWLPGGILTGVPVGYRVADTSIASLSNVQVNTARLTGQFMVRDSTWVYAETPTHLRDSVLITVVPPAAQLVKISGDGQGGVVGTPLAAPLVVRVLDQLGGGFLGATVAWTGSNALPSAPTSLSDDSGYASVMVTPSATGTVTVTASAPGLTGSPQTFTAQGLTGGVTGLVLTPDSAVVLNPGDTARFTAACSSSGLPVACPVIAWSSLDGAIGGVDGTGKVTAIGPGAARIRAAAGGGADTATFVVNAIATLTVLPVDTVITAVGDTVQLRARTTRFLGDTATLPNSQVVWQTLTPAVALVDTGGRARIVGPGTGFVRATSAGRSGVDTLRVRQTPVSFRVDPDTAIIGVGGTVILLPRPFDRRGFPIAGRRTTWLSRNPTAASVDTTGRVTGNAIDSAGVYVVGTDSTFSDSTLVRITTNPPLAIQWGTDSASVGRGTTFQQAMLLSVPAPAGGVPVRVVSSDTLILKPTTPLVTFTSGQTSRTVSLEGRAAGRVTVTATDTLGQFLSDTLIVGVLSTLEFRTIANPTSHATNFSINSAEQRAVLVFLSDPAPPGGLAVTFTPTVPSIAGVVPSTAVIPGGQLSVQVDLQGTGVGSTVLTPTASGYVGKSSTVNTSLAQFSVNLPFPQRLGVGQFFTGSISVPNQMDRATRVTLGRTTAGVGQAPDSVVIAAGNASAQFDYVALAPGSDTVTASLSGWTEGRAAVQVTTPLVTLNGIGPLNAGGPNVQWTAVARDSGGSAHVRFDTLTVNVVSRDTNVVRIDTASAVIQPGSATVTRNAVRPLGGGTTYVIVTALGHFSDSVPVTVVAPKLTFNVQFPSRIGTRQSLPSNSLSLPFTRPTPTVVQFVNRNPAVATPPDSVTIPANTSSVQFAIAGQTQGVDTIIVTAPGFSPDTGVVTVTSNGLTQSGLSTTYLLTAPLVSFNLRPTDSAGSIHPTLDTIVVAVSSTDTNVVSVDSTVVHILPGLTISNNVGLRMRGLGQARVRFSALPRYPLDSTFVITVNPPPLFLNVQFPGRLGLGQFAAFNSVSVSHQATDTIRVALTHPGTVRGIVTPDTLLILPGQSSAQFRWDAVALGPDTLVVSAAGFVDDTGATVMMRPRFNVSGIASAAVVNDTFFVSASAADSLGSVHTVVDTVFAVFQSTDTAVLAVDSTSLRRILPGASNTGQVRLIARGPGTARIIVAGTDSLYRPDTTNVVVVTAPAIAIVPLSVTLGTGQQDRVFRAFIPNGVADTTRIALTLSDTSVAGLSTDTIAINPGQTQSPLFTVFAKQVIASIQLTASAPGFTQGTSTIIVGTPQLFVNTSTTGYVGQGPINVAISTRDQTSTNREVHDTLVITLSSTNPAVLVPESTTVRVPANAASVSTTWRTVGAGTAYLVASAPGYPTDSSSLLTVLVPPLNLTLDRSVGVGQRLSGTISIPFSLPAGDSLFVTLNSSNRSALTIPVVDTIFPFGSAISFTAVGAAIGTTITSVSAPGFTTSAPDTTQVGTPRLQVNGPNSGTSPDTVTVSITAEDQQDTARPVDQQLIITLTVSDTTIADFNGSASTQITINAGSQTSPSVQLSLKAAGNVTITATAAGYTNGIRIITVN